MNSLGLWLSTPSLIHTLVCATRDKKKHVISEISLKFMVNECEWKPKVAWKPLAPCCSKDEAKRSLSHILPAFRFVKIPGSKGAGSLNHSQTGFGWKSQVARQNTDKIRSVSGNMHILCQISTPLGRSSTFVDYTAFLIGQELEKSRFWCVNPPFLIHETSWLYIIYIYIKYIT